MRMSKDRFDYYSAIVARFDSVASCGHGIKKGELIGYNPSIRDIRGQKKTQCASCWAKWVSENAEAEAIERGYLPTIG